MNASEDPQIVYDTVESIIEKKIKMVPSRFLADYEYNNNCFEASSQFVNYSIKYTLFYENTFDTYRLKARIILTS